MKTDQGRLTPLRPRPPPVPPKHGKLDRRRAKNISNKEEPAKTNSSLKKEEKPLTIEERNLLLLDQLFQKYAAEEILRNGFKDNILGVHPLLVVASMGHDTGVDKLLRAGADVNFRNPQDGSTPLILAIKGAHLSVVKKLLDSGARVQDTNEEGNNAFMVAVSTGNADLVNQLWQCRRHFNLSSQNKKGRTALHMAVARQWDSCVNMLVTGGADTHRQEKDGTTPLILAARKGDRKTVERLLKARTDILQEDAEHSTAICVAMQEDHMELASYLLKNLSVAMIESYTKSRIDMLHELPDTEDTDDYLHDILYPVLRLLGLDHVTRDLMLRNQLLRYWIPVIKRSLELEELSEKAFHILCEIMYGNSDMAMGTDSCADRPFVEEFVKQGGPDMVQSAFEVYSNGGSIEMTAAVCLLLLPLVHVKMGKRWLEQNYHKVAEHVEYFKNNKDTLDYADDGAKLKVEHLWKKFNVVFVQIHAVQSNRHCAELMASEERDKVRKERKRQKKKQKRKRTKTLKECAQAVTTTPDDLMVNEGIFNDVSDDEQQGKKGTQTCSDQRGNISSIQEDHEEENVEEPDEPALKCKKNETRRWRLKDKKLSKSNVKDCIFAKIADATELEATVKVNGPCHQPMDSLKGENSFQKVLNKKQAKELRKRSIMKDQSQKPILNQSAVQEIQHSKDKNTQIHFNSPVKTVDCDLKRQIPLESFPVHSPLKPDVAISVRETCQGTFQNTPMINRDHHDASHKGEAIKISSVYSCCHIDNTIQTQANHKSKQLDESAKGWADLFKSSSGSLAQADRSTGNNLTLSSSNHSTESQHVSNPQTAAMHLPVNGEVQIKVTCNENTIHDNKVNPMSDIASGCQCPLATSQNVNDDRKPYVKRGRSLKTTTLSLSAWLGTSPRTNDHNECHSKVLTFTDNQPQVLNEIGSVSLGSACSPSQNTTTQSGYNAVIPEKIGPPHRDSFDCQSDFALDTKDDEAGNALESIETPKLNYHRKNQAVDMARQQQEAEGGSNEDDAHSFQAPEDKTRDHRSKAIQMDPEYDVAPWALETSIPSDCSIVMPSAGGPLFFSWMSDYIPAYSDNSTEYPVCYHSANASVEENQGEGTSHLNSPTLTPSTPSISSCSTSSTEQITVIPNTADDYQSLIMEDDYGNQLIDFSNFKPTSELVEFARLTPDSDDEVKSSREMSWLPDSFNDKGLCGQQAMAGGLGQDVLSDVISAQRCLADNQSLCQMQSGQNCFDKIKWGYYSPPALVKMLISGIKGSERCWKNARDRKYEINSSTMMRMDSGEPAYVMTREDEAKAAELLPWGLELEIDNGKTPPPNEISAHCNHKIITSVQKQDETENQGTVLQTCPSTHLKDISESGVKSAEMICLNTFSENAINIDTKATSDICQGGHPKNVKEEGAAKTSVIYCQKCPPHHDTEDEAKTVDMSCENNPNSSDDEAKSAGMEQSCLIQALWQHHNSCQPMKEQTKQQDFVNAKVAATLDTQDLYVMLTQDKPCENEILKQNEEFKPYQDQSPVRALVAPNMTVSNHSQQELQKIHVEANSMRESDNSKGNPAALESICPHTGMLKIATKTQDGNNIDYKSSLLPGETELSDVDMTVQREVLVKQQELEPPTVQHGDDGPRENPPWTKELISGGLALYQRKRSDKWQKLFNKLSKYPDHKLWHIGKITLCQDEQFVLGFGSNGAQTLLGLLDDGAEVAVKCFQLQRFKKVKYIYLNRAMAQTGNNHLVPVLAIEEDDTHGYVAMGLGELSLGRLISDKPEWLTQSLHLRQSLVFSMLQGLCVLHEEYNIPHGNLKPSNVILGPDKEVQLTDWGIKMDADADNCATPEYDNEFSDCWHSSDTRFSDPHGLATAEYDSRKADIQVMGMLMYYVLTGGKHPYGENCFDIQMNVRRGWPTTLERITEAADDLIQRMLSCDPKERPTAREAILHPYFWNDREKLHFLLLVAHKMNADEDKQWDVLRDQLNSGCFTWLHRIDQALLKQIRMFLPDTPHRSTIGGLLLFMEQCIICKPLLSFSNRRLLEKPLKYFLSICPDLTLQVYRVTKECNMDMVYLLNDDCPAITDLLKEG